MSNLSVERSADPRISERRYQDQVINQVINWPHRMLVHEKGDLANVHTPIRREALSANPSKTLLRWAMTLSMVIGLVSIIRMASVEASYKANQHVNGTWFASKVSSAAFPDNARYRWLGYHRISGNG